MIPWSFTIFLNVKILFTWTATVNFYLRQSLWMTGDTCVSWSLLSKILVLCAFLWTRWMNWHNNVALLYYLYKLSCKSIHFLWIFQDLSIVFKWNITKSCIEVYCQVLAARIHKIFSWITVVCYMPMVFLIWKFEYFVLELYIIIIIWKVILLTIKCHWFIQSI